MSIFVCCSFDLTPSHSLIHLQLKTLKKKNYLFRFTSSIESVTEISEFIIINLSYFFSLLNSVVVVHILLYGVEKRFGFYFVCLLSVGPGVCLCLCVSVYWCVRLCKMNEKKRGRLFGIQNCALCVRLSRAKKK